MATILNDAAYMALPMNIKRGNPIPLDTTAVWYDKTELETYAASGATAYVGQVLTLIANGKAEAYMISNEAGTLVKLAQTTASGDLASDVATLQAQVNDLVSKVGKAAAGEEAATGLYKEIADVLTVAEEKVASVGAADGTINILGTDAQHPQLKVALSDDEDNALVLAPNGLKVVVPDVTHPEYKLTTATTTEGMLKSYKLTKDGADVDGSVVIDIPKDLVVKSGSVATYSAGNLPEGVAEAGTYIVIVLSNDDTLYIKADGLVDVYGGAVASDKIITVNVDPATKTITATIADGSVTKAKLAVDVQTSLGKADSAVQSVATGSDNGTIAVDGTDVAVKGLGDAAYTTVEALNAAAKGYADAAKNEVLGTAFDSESEMTVAGVRNFAEKQAEAALTGAKAYTDDAITKLDVEDSAKTGEFVTAVSETDGKISVSRRALTADDIPEIGQSKVAGLASALAAKQDNLTFNTEYDASTNKAATMSDVNAAKSALVGGEEDTKDSNTIKGAKLYTDAKASDTLTSAKDYADAKASDALTSAKAYADSIVSGDDGLSKRVESLEGKVDVTKVSTAIETAKDEAVAAAGTAADTKVAAAKTAILGEEGYAQTVKSAYELAASKTTMEAVEAKGYATKTEAQGYATAAANGKDAAIAEAKKAGTDAQASVNTLAGKVGTLPESATSTTVVGYVDEQIGKIPAQTDYTVEVEPTTAAGLAKRYVIKQASTGLNVNIDIPTDMVVKSGSVETDPAGQTPGTYLVLTLANAENDKVYINVGNLIEYVVGGADEDGIITTSVTIAANGDHVLTAMIGDGKITKAKLATSIQTSLDKADTAIQAAGLATALEPYAKTEEIAADYVTKNGTDRLMTVAEGEKLAGVAEDAQVNVIESIKVNGVAQTPTAKAVDIAVPVADDTSIALTENKLSVKSVSTDLLAQGALELIIDGGHA